MIITVVNMSASITDAALHPVIRAINRQIREDFEPYWSLGATLRLEGNTGKSKPNKVDLPEMRGDAVLYLWDKVDIPDALGYHDANARGLPFGFIFTELIAKLNESWSVTLSHEALELVADPLANLLVAGPHPQEDRTVFHWYEMSDAVQGEHYQIDGIDVSNFVLPLYFTPGSEPGSRNDFLGTKTNGQTLASFGVNPGGYIGFYDPQANDNVTFANAGDQKAKDRLAVKGANTQGRRAHRRAVWPQNEGVKPHADVRSRSMATPASAETGRHYERIDAP